MAKKQSFSNWVRGAFADWTLNKAEERVTNLDQQLANAGSLTPQQKAQLELEREMAADHLATLKTKNTN